MRPLLSAYEQLGVSKIRRGLKCNRLLNDIFKLTFEFLILCGQQRSFSTHERMILWKCQSFWDRKGLELRGIRTPNLQIHAECSNHLSYQGQIFCCPMFFFNTNSGGIDIFWSNVNLRIHVGVVKIRPCLNNEVSNYLGGTHVFIPVLSTKGA